MSNGEIPAISEDAPIIWEHPDDWNMHEGAFAKRCSQLGYRFLTLADRKIDKRRLTDNQEFYIVQIEGYLEELGG